MERGGVARKHESIHWVKGSGPPWDGITAYQHRAELNLSGRIPFFVQRKTWLEEEEEEGRWMEIGNGE